MFTMKRHGTAMFISSVAADTNRVRPLAQALTHRGFEVWAPDGPHAAERWIFGLTSALKWADAFLVYCSEDYLASASALFEAGALIGRGGLSETRPRVFILLGPGVTTKQLPGPLRKVRAVGTAGQSPTHIASVLARLLLGKRELASARVHSRC